MSKTYKNTHRYVSYYASSILKKQQLLLLSRGPLYVQASIYDHNTISIAKQSCLILWPL